MKARGLKRTDKHEARRRLINEYLERKRLREESEALTTDAVFDWGEDPTDEPSERSD